MIRPAAHPCGYLVLALLLATASLGAASPEPEAGSPAQALSWVPFDGSAGWSLTLDEPPPSASEGSLTVSPWHERLPDLDVRLLGGDVLPLSETRGSVVVLEFWATWCVPCQHALPQLQKVYDEHHDDGLIAVAINVGDSPQIVVPFAEDMGLTLPIGIFQKWMQPSLFGKAVPALVVADRRGNLRGRWDGYEPIHDKEISALISKLLSEDAEPVREVATVHRGAGRLRMDWYRHAAGVVEDLTVARGPDGETGILVSHARLMAFHLPDGRTDLQWSGDRAAGKVRLAPAGDGPSLRCASFRPGGRKIVLLNHSGGEKSTIELPSFVFDVAWLPPGDGTEGERLVAATLDGLLVLDLDGTVVARPEGFSGVSALARLGEGNASSLLVLESSGRLSRVDRSFARTAEFPTGGPCRPPTAPLPWRRATSCRSRWATSCPAPGARSHWRRARDA
jgi:thiol-disulfide isomerase/thioredoxin